MRRKSSLMIMMNILVLVIIVCIVQCRGQKQQGEDLRFREDGNFSILILSDLHYGESEQKDIETTDSIQMYIERVQPDLVIINGDAVTGYAWNQKQISFYHEAWRRFTEPMIQAQIQYALVIGSEDTLGDLRSEQIYDLDKKNPFSTKKYKIDNNNNNNEFSYDYYIQVYSHKFPNKLNAVLWAFDTHVEDCHIGSWGCLYHYQANWFKNKQNDIQMQFNTNQQNEKNLIQLAFLHAPLTEFMYMYNEVQVSGQKLEDVSCVYQENGLNFFDVLRENGKINSIFVAKDHKNNYGGTYKGVNLQYCTKSGFGGYQNYGRKIGALVINLSEDTHTGIIYQNTYSINQDGVISNLSKPKKNFIGIQDTCPIRKSIHLFDIRKLSVWPWILGICLALSPFLFCVLLQKKKWKNTQQTQELHENTNFLEHNPPPDDHLENKSLIIIKNLQT